MKKNSFTNLDKIKINSLSSIIVYFVSGLYFSLSSPFNSTILLLWAVIFAISILTLFAYNYYKDKYTAKIKEYFTSFYDWFYSLGKRSGMPDFILKEMMLKMSTSSYAISPRDALLFNFSEKKYTLVETNQINKETLYSKLQETVEKVDDDYAYYLAAKILLPFPIAIALMFGKVSTFPIFLISILIIFIPIMLEFKNNISFLPEEIFNVEISKISSADSEKLLQLYSLIKIGYSNQEALASLVSENQSIILNINNDFFQVLKNNDFFSFNVLHPLILTLFSMPSKYYDNLFPPLINEIQRFEKQITTLITKKKVLGFRNFIMGIIGIFSLSTYFHLSPFFHPITNHNMERNNLSPLFFSVIFSLSIMLSLLELKSVKKTALTIALSFLAWITSLLLVNTLFPFAFNSN